MKRKYIIGSVTIVFAIVISLGFYITFAQQKAKEVSVYTQPYTLSPEFTVIDNVIKGEALTQPAFEKNLGNKSTLVNITTSNGQYLYTVNGELVSEINLTGKESLIGLSHGLMLVSCGNGRYGYMNLSGQYYLPPVYCWASPFNEFGVAAVEYPKNNFYFIDMEGNPANDNIYDELMVYDQFYIGKLENSDQRILIAPDLEHLYEGFEYATIWYDEFLIFEVNNLSGLYHIGEKQLLLPPEYTQINITELNDGYYFVISDQVGTCYYNPTTKKQYDYVETSLDYPVFINRHIMEYPTAYDEDGEEQITPDYNILIDINGNALFQAQNIYYLNHNFYTYKMSNDFELNDFGLVDDTGKVLLDPVYETISMLDENNAVVSDGQAAKLINLRTMEETDLGCKTAKAQSLCVDIPDTKGIFFTTQDDLYGLMDSKGNILIEPEFEDLYPFYSHVTHKPNEGEYTLPYILLHASKNGKHGVVDGTGNIIIDIIYENVNYNGQDGIFNVTNDYETYTFYFRCDPAAKKEYTASPATFPDYQLPESDYEPVLLLANKTLAMVDKTIYLSKAAPTKTDQYIYADLFSFYGEHFSYSVDRDDNEVVAKQFNYPTGMLYFTKGETQVEHWYYNENEHVYNKETIHMDEPFEVYESEYVLLNSFPLDIISQAVGLPFLRDDENGIYVFASEDTGYYMADDIGRLNEAIHFDDFPREDGSTATAPFAVTLYSYLTKLDEAQITRQINHSKTFQAFEYLLDGYKDIIFASGPPEELWEKAAEMEIELTSTPFAIDGFVFFVNGDNPVESLTLQQIQDIYQGKITNWKEVGGNDLEILPYQRNEDSGSQAHMKQLVMKDLAMMKPTLTQKITGMGQIIEKVAEYENAEGALGYSVYFFASEMHINDNIKLIAVDGIEPNPATIANETYPLIFTYNMTLRKDDPIFPEKREKLQQIVDLVLSDTGRELIIQSRMIPYENK